MRLYTCWTAELSHHVGQLALIKMEQNQNGECAITVHMLNS